MSYLFNYRAQSILYLTILHKVNLHLKKLSKPVFTFSQKYFESWNNGKQSKILSIYYQEMRNGAFMKTTIRLYDHAIKYIDKL